MNGTIMNNVEMFSIGQRWISEMEPELGVGLVTEISNRTVRIVFPAAETERQYAVATAPLKRLQFHVGDTIQTRDGDKHKVTEIERHAGALIYICSDQRVDEKDLDSVFHFFSPKDRLLGGFFDSNAAYNLRIKALQWRARHAQSPAFGFIGARIDLLPHQLYVASKVAARIAPRVLLSDEVGLGKTIEACLILHRLLLSRRIVRALIFVPDALVHQWFVELLRRFNLVFRIFDSDYLDSLPEGSGNPFINDQLALISIEFLMKNEYLSADVLSAGWDMVIVDEVHHILEDTPEYRFLQQLARGTKGLLLLTATPEQLGHRSHFARLKLLDPDRYYDFQKFEAEEQHYEKTAELVNALLRDGALNQREYAHLKQLNLNPRDCKDLSRKNRDNIIHQLIDRYGMGRVIFRNSRATIPNFPKRQAFFYALDAEDTVRMALDREFEADCEKLTIQYDYKNDPRILWLAHFIKRHKSKILLICRTLEKALAIQSSLATHVAVKAALFHEKLTLLQRDRNAAWFAQEDGAQLLICSEIGSEGRNFQFSHHLILFDVPFDPELLEQRIGRLDRIGQKQTINIHIPYVTGTGQESLIRWYHEGFHAFEQNVSDAFLILEKFGEAIKNAARSKDRAAVDHIIRETGVFHAHMSTQLEKGRNRLLELNSFRQAEAENFKAEIRALEDDVDFQNLMLQLFQHFDVTFDELTEKIHLIGHDHFTNSDFPFPAFRSDQVPVTFDRQIALSREDVEFLMPDHPTVMGAIDLLLGSEKGTAVCVAWESETQELFLEAFFIHECVAPASLFIERFFPPTPIRILVNHQGKNLTNKVSLNELNAKTKKTPNAGLFENPVIKNDLVPDMLDRCEEIAQNQAAMDRKAILDHAGSVMNTEIDRLQSLQKHNPNISADEITALTEEAQAIVHAIQSARCRLDSIRFIVKGKVPVM